MRRAKCPRATSGAFLCVGYCRVSKPPAGGAGGSELSGRTDPSAQARGARTDGRERGAGGGEVFSGFLRPHSDSELHPPLRCNING